MVSRSCMGPPSKVALSNVLNLSKRISDGIPNLWCHRRIKTLLFGARKQPSVLLLKYIYSCCISTHKRADVYVQHALLYVDSGAREHWLAIERVEYSRNLYRSAVCCEPGASSFSILILVHLHFLLICATFPTFPFPSLRSRLHSAPGFTVYNSRGLSFSSADITIHQFLFL